MSFNALSLAKLGVGFGARAAATLGIMTPLALQPAPPRSTAHDAAGVTAAAWQADRLRRQRQRDEEALLLILLGVTR